MIEIIKNILTDENFIGAFLTSLSFILLGFIFRKKNIINNDGKEVLTTIVLKIALPTLAFSAFMTEFNSDHFVDDFLVFIISLLFYIFFIIIGRFVLFKMDAIELRNVLRRWLNVVFTICLNSFSLHPKSFTSLRVMRITALFTFGGGLNTCSSTVNRYST